MTPSSAPLPNILLDDLKIHPELLTRLLGRDEELSVMLTKRGNEIAYEPARQLYLQRVTQFYAQLQSWLGNQDYTFSSVPRTFKDELGTYRGNKMVVELKQQKAIQKNFNKPWLVDFTPMGAASLLGEGVIEVSGWLTMEPLAYLPRSEPTRRLSSGQRQPLLKGVHEDGWYLLRDPRTRQVQLIDQDSLYTLITLVSDYEF